MDTSSRLDFVLGNLVVKQEELTTEEWLAIVENALDQAKPRLKYLPGFEPIQERFHERLGDYSYRIVAAEVNSFPEGFSGETRCLRISRFHVSAEGEIEGYGARYGVIRELLLTQKGRLVDWGQRYRREVEHGLGYRAHRTGVNEIAEVSTFIWIETFHLHKLIEVYPKACLGLKILDALHNACLGGVKDRQARLAEMNRLLDQLEQIRNRIQS